ncbi:hypothetical protein AB1K70_24660 [Bremerella sp. JC770]|uniref:hypothetical protein n=1 Tax=Bremerella sp. JC770 TaxID=3232137 RepID=UPI00345AC307
MKVLAIVGIACAAMLVCHLAAWYVVMEGSLAHRNDSSLGALMELLSPVAAWFLYPHRVFDGEYALLTSPFIVLVEACGLAAVVQSAVLFGSRRQDGTLD